jgi:hypothetical protein
MDHQAGSYSLLPPVALCRTPAEPVLKRAKSREELQVRHLYACDFSFFAKQACASAADVLQSVFLAVCRSTHMETAYAEANCGGRVLEQADLAVLAPCVVSTCRRSWLRSGQLRSSCQLLETASTRTTASSYSSSLSCRMHSHAWKALERATKSASSARIANTALSSAAQASRRALTQEAPMTVLQGSGARMACHSTNMIITQFVGVRTHHA